MQRCSPEAFVSVKKTNVWSRGRTFILASPMPKTCSFRDICVSISYTHARMIRIPCAFHAQEAGELISVMLCFLPNRVDQADLPLATLFLLSGRGYKPLGQWQRPKDASAYFLSLQAIIQGGDPRDRGSQRY